MLMGLSLLVVFLGVGGGIVACCFGFGDLCDLFG